MAGVVLQERDRKSLGSGGAEAGRFLSSKPAWSTE